MTNQEKYDLLMQAARTAPKGKLIQTAMQLLGTSSKNYIHTVRRRLELLGYDFAEWREAAQLTEKPLFVAERDKRQYALMIQAARTAPKGKVTQTAEKLLGVIGERSVRRIRRRLESKGYDFTEWYAAIGHQPAVSHDREDELYSKMIEAAQTARPGYLIQTAAGKTGLSSDGLRKARKRLEGKGYDLSAWHDAAALGQKVGKMLKEGHQPSAATPRPVARPRPAASNMPEQVKARRDQWYADIREVSGKTGAIGLLCQRWNCEAATAKGRIHSLRGTGYDLSWWDARGTDADKTAEVPLSDVQVNPLPLPVVAASKPGKAPKWKPELPYTMQGIADIVDMPVLAVRFAARAHGIGFDAWCLPPDIAIGLLAALGFTRQAAA